MFILKIFHISMKRYGSPDIWFILVSTNPTCIVDLDCFFICFLFKENILLFFYLRTRPRIIYFLLTYKALSELHFSSSISAIFFSYSLFEIMKHWELFAPFLSNDILGEIKCYIYGKWNEKSVRLKGRFKKKTQRLFT